MSCSLAWCCLSTPNSLVTRFSYGCFLFVGTIISGLLLLPSSAWFQIKIQTLCHGEISKNFSFTLKNSFLCKPELSYSNVYRIQFSMFSFFLLMAISMIGVKNIEDPRRSLQNGLWYIKIPLFLVLLIGICFIPKKLFLTILFVLGMIASFLFFLIQSIYLVDFGYRWANNWVSHGENHHMKYFFGLIFFAFLFYATSIVAIVFLFWTYGLRAACARNMWLIAISLLLMIIISIVPLSSKIRNANSNLGILQSAFVSLYIVFLTWSAVTNRVDVHGCRRIYSHESNAEEHQHLTSVGFNASTLVTLAIYVLVIIYLTVKRPTNNASVEFVRVPNSEDAVISYDYDDEKDEITYNYSIFHLMLGIASFYIMLNLTNWLKPSHDGSTFSSSTAEMWIKISASWACAAVYFWSMIAPCVCSNREFP